jgi:AraC family transcriptional regulator, transcriptional activator of pobA
MHGCAGRTGRLEYGVDLRGRANVVRERERERSAPGDLSDFAPSHRLCPQREHQFVANVDHHNLVRHVERGGPAEAVEVEATRTVQIGNDERDEVEPGFHDRVLPLAAASVESPRAKLVRLKIESCVTRSVRSRASHMVALAVVRAVRPLAYDSSTSRGRPVSAARQTYDCEAVPRRTPVTHSYAALAFYTGGRSRVELNGEWNLREGDVLLVPAGAPHRMLETRRPELWGLSFCVPCFAADGTAPLLEPFERVRDGAAAVVQVPSARHAHLEGLFRELEHVGHEPRGPSDTLDAVQRSLLTLILAEVDRASSASGVPRATGGGVVVDALRFIERNCLGQLTLGKVAAALGRSPTYVTSALSRATGRSAVQWIVSGRMAEARRLLLHSDEMVDVVAERVGYADATHFIRMFRREHGATPAAWRAAQARGPRVGG